MARQDATTDADAVLQQHRALLEAGRTLAGLAEPHRDLLAYGGDFVEIASTLKFIGAGLERAYTLASAHDAVGRDDLRDSEEYAALVGALRTGRKALVDLARLLTEIETVLQGER